MEYWREKNRGLSAHQEFSRLREGESTKAAKGGAGRARQEGNWGLVQGRGICLNQIKIKPSSDRDDVMLCAE
jgi:hypothetical protein